MPLSVKPCKPRSNMSVLCPVEHKETTTHTFGLDDSRYPECRVLHEIPLPDRDCKHELVPRSKVPRPYGTTLLRHHEFQTSLIEHLRVVERVRHIHPSVDVALDPADKFASVVRRKDASNTYSWETFSSMVIRGSRSLTRSSMDALGFL